MPQSAFPSLSLSLSLLHTSDEAGIVARNNVTSGNSINIKRKIIDVKTISIALRIIHNPIPWQILLILDNVASIIDSSRSSV